MVALTKALYAFTYKILLLASPRIKTKDFSNVENVKFRFVMRLIVADIPASSYIHCFAK
jgi:hypothetical protein